MNLNGPIAINGPGAIDLIWSELAEARGVAKRSFSWLFPVCSWITRYPELGPDFLLSAGVVGPKSLLTG